LPTGKWPSCWGLYESKHLIPLSDMRQLYRLPLRPAPDSIAYLLFIKPGSGLAMPGMQNRSRTTGSILHLRQTENRGVMTKPPANLITTDLAPGPDQTGEIMYVPHPNHPGCGNTALFDEQLVLFRLGLLPLRCKSCGELLTDREGA
jgi:hypothetical protein